jgi:hypothetical protein
LLLREAHITSTAQPTLALEDMYTPTMSAPSSPPPPPHSRVVYREIYLESLSTTGTGNRKAWRCYLYPPLHSPLGA